MTALRVIHHIDETVDHGHHTARVAAVRARPGVREAEAYAALDGSGRLAVVELWDDEAAFDSHVRDARVATTDAVLLARHAAGVAATPAEIYRHQPFRNDRVWVAGESAPDDGAAPPAIAWPARGAVRIVLQLCLVATDELVAALADDEAATRLEPGCRQYGWFRSVETPGHVLLLELWDDQQTYDHHWHLRLKTGPQAIPMTFAERTRGSNGIEFYRHQPFTFLYDRWLPADQQQWSETVVWPA